MHSQNIYNFVARVTVGSLSVRLLQPNALPYLNSGNKLRPRDDQGAESEIRPASRAVLALEDELLEALDKFVVKQGRPLTRDQAVRMILVDALISYASPRSFPHDSPCCVGTIHRAEVSLYPPAGSWSRSG
jgi:hypothetical protein